MATFLSLAATALVSATTSTFRVFSCACQLLSTVYLFARLVQLFSYPTELFRDPMAIRVEVDDNDSSPDPSRSCSTAPVHSRHALRSKPDLRSAD